MSRKRSTRSTSDYCSHALPHVLLLPIFLGSLVPDSKGNGGGDRPPHWPQNFFFQLVAFSLIKRVYSSSAIKYDGLIHCLPPPPNLKIFWIRHWSQAYSPISANAAEMCHALYELIARSQFWTLSQTSLKNAFANTHGAMQIGCKTCFDDEQRRPLAWTQTPRIPWPHFWGGQDLHNSQYRYSFCGEGYDALVAKGAPRQTFLVGHIYICIQRSTFYKAYMPQHWDWGQTEIITCDQSMPNFPLIAQLHLRESRSPLRSRSDDLPLPLCSRSTWFFEPR